jgi:hypothetical protein
LKKRGLEIRRDSALCRRYIYGLVPGVGLSEVVDTMVEMDVLWNATPYGDINRVVFAANLETERVLRGVYRLPGAVVAKIREVSRLIAMERAYDWVGV